MVNRLRELRERAADERGFTLIELLVVVVIMGILIGIAVPLYLNYQKTARDRSAESDLRGAMSAFEACNSDNGFYPVGPTGDKSFSASGSKPTNCTQTISLSSGTTITYYTNGGAAPSGYSATATNSSGTGAIFCYTTGSGGSVAKSNSIATYVPACPAAATN